MIFKRIFFLKIFVFLLLAAIIVTIRGHAQEDTNISSQYASQIAKEFLTTKRSIIPDWQEAIILPPKAHYDLSGNITAYVLPLTTPSGEDVGYIAVSGEIISNPILEYSTEPARYRNRLGDIAIATNQGIVIDIEKPLYLGVLAYFYPIKNSETLKLLRMGSGDIVEITNIPVSILEWNEQEQVINGSSSGVPDQIFFTSSPIRKILYGPDYFWYLGCTPTAVGNVMGFWADRGYPNLVYGGSKGDYRGTIDQLAKLMGTSPEGWTWFPIKDDIVHFTNLRAYPGFRSDEIYSPSFSKLRSEIDNNRPLAVLVNGHIYYGDHSITMFGYEYDANIPNYQYMMVHDTWGNGDYWVQYGVGYDRIWMDTINPPQIQLDLTPPTSKVRPLEPYQTTNDFILQWSGVDEGWGVAGYIIQYRDGITGTWTDWWIAEANIKNAKFTGLRGHQYFFRSSAFDIDHNYEPYDQENGDTSTLIAQYVLSGKVITNRNEPIMAALVATDPSALGTSFSDSKGEYRIGLMSSGNYTVTIEGNSNFGTLPSINQIQTLDEVSLPVVTLPPSVNFLVNGTFENGLSNWSTGGVVSPTITTSPLTGKFALALGENPPEDGGDSYISQVITMPLEIDQPTLSFEYRSISNWNTTQLNILISGDTAVSNTIPLDSTEWRHAWFDLSDYKGQNIKVDFRVPESTLSYPNTVLLDDISIGPASPGVKNIFLPRVSR